MRKRFMLSVLLLIGLFFLVGCSNDGEGENESSDEAGEKDAPQEKEDDKSTDEQKIDDVDAFIEEVTNANLKVTSFSVDTTIDMLSTFGDKEQQIVFTQKDEVVLDPYQQMFYKKTEIQSDLDPEHGNPEDEELTRYTIDGYSYTNLKSSLSDGVQWLKRENESSDDEMSEEISIDVKQILEDYSEVTTDMNVVEEDSIYRLIVDFDLDLLAELSKEAPEFAQLEEEEVNEKLLETYVVEESVFELTFDKESKYILGVEMVKTSSYEMEFEDETDTMRTVGTTEANYLNHNEIDEIVLPDEAIENAVENTN